MAAWDDHLRWKALQPVPNRCPYCGVKCRGRACGSHADLLRREAQEAQEVQEAHGDKPVDGGENTA